jgi:hypothetical protein
VKFDLCDAQAELVATIGVVCLHVPPSDRRALLCAIHEHVTACIANMDEITRIVELGKRAPVNHLAWGDCNKEGAD